MATNYTTKTAALKATTADIRKVTAKTVDADEIKVVTDVDAEGNKTYSNVTTLIEEAQKSAAISVGRDADKNWKVDTDAITAVKKINFLGDYVNVVEGTNGEVSLYIGENKSQPEMKSGIFNSVPSNEASVYVYTCEEDGHDFNLPVAAGAATSAYKTIPVEGGSFNSVTLTAVPTNYPDADENPNLVFTLNSKDSIWTRLTYNDDVVGDGWTQVKLDENRGTYDDKTSTPSTVAVALHDGVTMNIGNYVLTAETDAKRGKVPGRCETQFNIELNLDTIAKLDGGKIKFEYAIQETQPTGTVSAMSLFLTQYKKPTIASVNATYDTRKQQTVSGLTYNITGSTAKISTGTITNSQWKSAPTQNRLTINAAGNSTTYAISQLVATGDVKTSNVTYALAETTLGLGASGSGTASIKATPLSHSNGNAASTTLPYWWGSIPASNDTTEKFGVETTYRMAKVDSTGNYPNTTRVNDATVLSSIPTTSYSNLIQAVCQYGELKHPKNAAATTKADGTSEQPYSALTTDAIFIRKFKPSRDQNLTLKGTNIGKAKAVYWFDGATYHLISKNVTGRYVVSNNQIDVIWSSAVHQPITLGSPTVMIIIVMGSDSPNIGQITLS